MKRSRGNYRVVRAFPKTIQSSITSLQQHWASKLLGFNLQIWISRGMSKYGGRCSFMQGRGIRVLGITTMPQSTLFTAVREDEIQSLIKRVQGRSIVVKGVTYLHAILLHLGLHPSAAGYSGEPRQAPRIVWEAFLSVLDERHLFF